MHLVDQVFADLIQRFDGFEAYHPLACGHGEILSIRIFRDQSSADGPDD